MADLVVYKPETDLNDANNKDIMKEVAKELGLPLNDVVLVINGFHKFLVKTLREDSDYDLTNNVVNTNFRPICIPYVGEIYKKNRKTKYKLNSNEYKKRDKLLGGEPES
jgi:hypothetical protein